MHTECSQNRRRRFGGCSPDRVCSRRIPFREQPRGKKPPRFDSIGVPKSEAITQSSGMLQAGWFKAKVSLSRTQ